MRATDLAGVADPATGRESDELAFHRVTLFNPRQGEDRERLWSQTKLIFGLGFGVAGVLYAMPSEITNWDKSQTGNLHTRWWNNVSQGPVWDRDDYVINYVGHSYFGGVYYQVARKSGYGQWDSFVYSALMSTFYWEYGLEAFAEVPSIQDIIVTPIGGWFYGEWAHRREQRIIASGGTVMGSHRLGQVSLFFLDPVDAIGRGLNRMTGTDWIKTGNMSVFHTPVERVAPHITDTNDAYWGVQLVLQF